MKQTQRGMTMIGFLMMLCLGIFFAFCAMKIVPMYIEYYSVKKMLATISKNPEAASGSKEKIRDLFRRGLEIDYVKVIKPDMLKIESTDGGMKMIVDDERRENLMANLDVVGKFHAEQVMARGAGGY